MPIREMVTGTTSVTRKRGKEVVSETSTNDNVGEVTRQGSLCNVGYSLKLVKNQGNFESIAVQVSLNAPVPEREVDEGFDQVEAWVHSKMEETFTKLGLD